MENQMTTAEAIQAVTAMETVDELRKAADSMGVKYSGNTGEGTLRKNIMDVLNAQLTQEPEEKAEQEPTNEASFLDQAAPMEPIEVAKIPKKPEAPTIVDLIAMDPKTIDDPNLRRQVVRAKALRLVRVKITNLDPGDAQLEGAIITVQNKYTGKVSKFVPFGEQGENGYHIPQIIYNYLKTQRFAQRKEIKGGQFGVKRYRTTMVNKYQLEVLPLLSPKEIDELAAHQRASHAIDN